MTYYMLELTEGELSAIWGALKVMNACRPPGTDERLATAVDSAIEKIEALRAGR